MKLSNVVKVTNENGLHTRPAGALCNLTNKPDYAPLGIFLMYNGIRVDAKSILNVLSIGAVPGAELVLEIEADDADKDTAQSAMDEISSFFENSFNEADS